MRPWGSRLPTKAYVSQRTQLVPFVGGHGWWWKGRPSGSPGSLAWFPTSWVPEEGCPLPVPPGMACVGESSCTRLRGRPTGGPRGVVEAGIALELLLPPARPNPDCFHLVAPFCADSTGAFAGTCRPELPDGRWAGGRGTAGPGRAGMFRELQ